MANNSPVLYCCCIKDKPARFTTSAPMTQIIAGATYLTKEERSSHAGFIFDDEGGNISCLNPWFGDLTVLHWAWKNAADDFLGVCQYRRPWEEHDLVASEEDVLYVPTPAVFGNVEQQYMDCHSVFNVPSFSRELARQGKLPLSFEMVDHAWRQPLFYGCNMARGPKVLFDKYCELVFATMMPLWEEHQQLCQGITGYQQRTIAFAAERMITALIINKDYFFGPGKMKEARIGFTG